MTPLPNTQILTQNNLKAKSKEELILAHFSFVCVVHVHVRCPWTVERWTVTQHIQRIVIKNHALRFSIEVSWFAAKLLVNLQSENFIF